MKVKNNDPGTRLAQEIIQFAKSNNIKVRKKEGPLLQPPRLESTNNNIGSFQNFISTRKITCITNKGPSRLS